MSSRPSARGYATSSGQFHAKALCTTPTCARLTASSLICRHWIQEFWMMFRLHHSLSDRLDQFRELIREQGQEHLCSLLETKFM